MGEDRPTSLGAAAAVPSAVALWRQRLAGGLLLTGAVVSIGALFVPWTYTYWPPDRQCPGCLPKTHAPVDTWANPFSGPQSSVSLRLFWLALLVGLPLAFGILGVRLIARDRLVRLRWKVLIILASIAAFCATIVLAAVMGFAAFDSTAAVRPEIGEWAALAVPFAVLIAGIVMPVRIHMAP